MVKPKPASVQLGRSVLSLNRYFDSPYESRPGDILGTGPNVAKLHKKPKGKAIQPDGTRNEMQAERQITSKFDIQLDQKS